MDMNPFSGLGIALITPFNEDGSIDFNALTTIVEKQLEERVDFLCVLGTTAETPCLNNDERVAVMQHVKQVVRGRVPLLLGAGANCTAQVVDGLKNTDLSGYDGVLIVAPYYNKPSQEGLYQHFKTIATHSPLPVVLYNVPGRTGVNIAAETTLRLANDFKNIIGIKEASGNLEQAKCIIDNSPSHFSVICGDDGLTLPMMKDGAIGIISVLANLYTAKFGEMVHLLQKNARDVASGDVVSAQACMAEAEKIHVLFKDMFTLLFKDGNPPGIKYAMYHSGLSKNVLRLPLVPVSSATAHALDDAMEVIEKLSRA